MSSSIVPSTSQAIESSQAAGKSLLWGRGLDLIEKSILLTFYGFFLVPIVESVATRRDLGAVLLAISETLVVALVLCRKPAQSLSQRPIDWFLAFGATLTPTLVRPVMIEPSVVTTFAALLMTAGVCFQIYAKFMLGRRFGVVAANRGICCKGPYLIVRHPIYMGYLMTHIGFLLMAASPWNILMYIITYSLMIPRIFAEERLLRRDAAYEAYCGKTKWRILPGVL